MGFDFGDTVKVVSPSGPGSEAYKGRQGKIYHVNGDGTYTVSLRKEHWTFQESELALVPAWEDKTLRDRFAMAALTGFVTSQSVSLADAGTAAKFSYAYAEAMLKERGSVAIAGDQQSQEAIISGLIAALEKIERYVLDIKYPSPSSVAQYASEAMIAAREAG